MASLGDLALLSAGGAVKFALRTLAAKTQVVDKVAAFAYERETGAKWDNVTTAERALWVARATNVMLGLAESVVL